MAVSVYSIFIRHAQRNAPHFPRRIMPDMSKDVRSRLVPRGFHRELVEAMTKVGFGRMHEFCATTDRDQYHVSARYAQETNHFFYLPGKGFLVHLALAECIDDHSDTYQLWWSGAVYLELDTYAMIEYEVRHVCPNHEGPQFFMDGCEPLGHVMGNIDELLEPFGSQGSSRFLDRSNDSYGWQIECAGLLTVEQLVTFVNGLADHFGPFLLPTLSRNFSVFGFTNTYSWPSIRGRFWKEFPTRLLKEMVPGRITHCESSDRRS